MTPLRFGADCRTCVGILHTDASSRARGAAVLICGPFGQEAIRIHRFFRILSERLVRGGVPSLRFDYFGTGDSPGDDADGDLVGWTADVRAAHFELMRRTGASQVTWVGTRLGATLAIRAAAVSGAHRLVLWDPIVDGARYLDDLQGRQDAALKANFGQSFLRMGSDPRSELLGFEISPLLRQQVSALGPRLLALPKGCSIDVLLARESLDARQWVVSERDRGAQVRIHELDNEFDWTTEEAMNSALVPQEALTLLHGLLVPSS